MATKKNQTFGEFVDGELDKRGSSRRWLMAQLKEVGLFLTDTQLSNRCTGFIPFQEYEIMEIEKVLGVEYPYKKKSVDK